MTIILENIEKIKKVLKAATSPADYKQLKPPTLDLILILIDQSETYLKQHVTKDNCRDYLVLIETSIAILKMAEMNQLSVMVYNQALLITKTCNKIFEQLGD